MGDPRVCERYGFEATAGRLPGIRGRPCGAKAATFYRTTSKGRPDRQDYSFDYDKFEGPAWCFGRCADHPLNLSVNPGTRQISEAELAAFEVHSS